MATKDLITVARAKLAIASITDSSQDSNDPAKAGTPATQLIS
jgi:hypothetical protein